MANLFQKKEANKRDMNFFEEYAAASRRLASIYRWAVVVAFIVVAFVVVYAIALFINLRIKQSEIDAYVKKFEQPEYVSLIDEANRLEAEYNSREAYYYALTVMRRDVDQITSVDPGILGLIQDSIPNDAVVGIIDLSGTALSITGNTTNYYAVSEMYHLMNQSGEFASNPILMVDRNESGISDLAAGANNFQPSDYQFDIQTAINGDSIISVTAIVDSTGTSIGGIYIGNTNETTASGVTTLAIENGAIVTIGSGDNGISRITNGTETYVLSSVLINQTALSPADLQSVIDTGVMARYVDQNLDIELHYTIEAQEEAE